MSLRLQGHRGSNVLDTLLRGNKVLQEISVLYDGFHLTTTCGCCPRTLRHPAPRQLQLVPAAGPEHPLGVCAQRACFGHHLHGAVRGVQPQLSIGGSHCVRTPLPALQPRHGQVGHPPMHAQRNPRAAERIVTGRLCAAPRPTHAQDLARRS